MGYRPHIVKQCEISYGDSINGFCYKSDGFDWFLDLLGVGRNWEQNDSGDIFYIAAEDVKKIKDMDLSGIDFSECFHFGETDDKDKILNIAKEARGMLVQALDTEYCRKNNEIMISFF